MTASRFLLLALLIASTPASAGVYKWTDAQGRVHYSDNPPADAKAQQVKVKINSIQGPAVVSTIRDTSAAKAKDKVRIYTAVWCGYCKRAKAHLAAKGVPYDEMDVETSERGRSEFAQLGGRGVPVILVGGQRMDGFDASALDAMLTRAGW
jgi:glutaredoxin